MNISRKERDEQRRRDEILRASLSIFASQGFHGTTMAQISQESQYPLGTIYKYFSSKKQIYHDLVMERIHQLGQLFFNISHRDDLSAHEKLKEAFFAKVKFYKKNSDFIRIYISERNTIDAMIIPRLSEKVNRMYEKEIDLFQTIFEVGGAPEFKRYPPREMALFFSEITHSVAWAAIFDGQGSPPQDTPSGEEEDEDTLPDFLEKRLDIIFDMFMHGVSNQKERGDFYPSADETGKTEAAKNHRSIAHES